MQDHRDSVMIALLPITNDWCQIECPHMTLVYAGETKDLQEGAFNELAKDACSLAMLSNYLYLRVMGIEVFGDEEKVDVLRILPSPELLAMRRAVESWNASAHPFRPHATIGPAGSFVGELPRHLVFDRIMVGWGDEQLTFWLKR